VIGVGGVRMAAWQHVEGRRGFEVARLAPVENGAHRIEGVSSGEDEGLAWGLRYTLLVDATWATRQLHLEGLAEDADWTLDLEADGAGRWRRDGAAAPELDGCVDVDLATTVLTNLLPIRRFGLSVEGRADLDAVWIGTPAGREVEPMPQRYERLGPRLYRYSSVGTDFSADLEIDEFGLVVAYPGLAQRVA
jgi:uncharacterized protein